MNEVEQSTLNLILSARMQRLRKRIPIGLLTEYCKNCRSYDRGILRLRGTVKEALFDALVGKHYQYFIDRFRKAQQEFADLPPDEQPNNLNSTSGECMHDMLLYAYDHLNEFKLILAPFRWNTVF